MSRGSMVGAVAGLVAGVFGSVCANAWLTRRPASDAHAAAASVVEDEEARPMPTKPSDASKEILAALAMAAAKPQAPREVAMAPPPPMPKEDRQEFSGALAAHAREVPDNVWAVHTKDGLSTDLKKLGASMGISGFDLDCRSKTCVGYIEWPSAAAGQQNLFGILRNEYTINSAVRVAPPESVGEGPFRVQVIFEPAPNEAPFIRPS